MGYFQSAEHLKATLGGFFQVLGDDIAMGPKLMASGLVLRFFYKNPDASITIDLGGEQMVIRYDEVATKADVEMSMEAEVAHRYWLGKIPLAIALARRQIKAKGPIPKILKLLPIIKNAHKMYPDYIQRAS